jgi:DHA1 family inner membrane transport protein
MAAMSVTWGITSLIAGTASDRLGRKAILTGAIVLVGAAMAGIGVAGTYPAAVLWVLAGGVGGGSFMGTVFATVSDHVPPARRGGSLGWVMTGQSLSLVLGVPLATIIGAQAGWRGAHLTFAGLTVLVGLAMLLLVPRRGAYQATGREAAEAAPLKTIMTPRILSLLISGTTERVCFAAMSVYLATFLISTYGVPLEGLAVALLLITLGNLVGNVIGGQLADRVRSRELLYGVSLAVTGLVAVPLLVWTPGLEISIGLGFVYTFANAIGRPSFMAALSSVPEAVRGTVLGLNVTFASVGWIAAAAFGGWLIAGSGFGSLGLFCAGSAMLGTVVLGLGGLRASRPLSTRPSDGSAPATAGS